MDHRPNGTPVPLDDQEPNHDPEQVAEAIRLFQAACLKVLRCTGGLKSIRTSLATAASSEQWGLEGDQFTADGRQVTWPLPAYIVQILEEREAARNELQVAVKLLLKVDLNPAQWARVAGEFWE